MCRSRSRPSQSRGWLSRRFPCGGSCARIVNPLISWPRCTASGAGRRSHTAGRRFREDVRHPGTLDFTPPLQHGDADDVRRPGPCVRGDRRLWLTAYTVAQRTREIGIRVSLGASPTQLVRGLVGQGLRLCLAGTAIGLVGAIVLGRFLRSLLFGVSATDGLTIVVVIATMTAVVVAATYLPASRASRIDPILALRQE